MNPDVFVAGIFVSVVAWFTYVSAHSTGPAVQPKMTDAQMYIKFGKIGFPVVDLKAEAEEKRMQTGQSRQKAGLPDTYHTSDKNVSTKEIEYCYVNIEDMPVACDDNHHCCGYGRKDRRCCPNLSAGAIFGIISSLLFISIFFASITCGCCIWFECTLFVRPKGRKKSSLFSVSQSSAISQDLDVMETGFSGDDKDRRVSSLKNELETKIDENTNYEYSEDNTETNHLLLALPQQNDPRA